MGTNEFQIFLNDQYKDRINIGGFYPKLGGFPDLKEIRKLCTKFIPKDGENYYFIDKDDQMKIVEDGYDIKNFYKEIRVNNSIVYRIDLKTELFHQGKYIDIFINNEHRITELIKSSDKLTEVRARLQDIIPQNKEYYFISKNQYIIRNEDKKASEILKKYNGRINKYRIDLQTLDFFESNNFEFYYSDIYINGVMKDSIKLRNNYYSLEEIRQLCRNIIPNNDNYYFISKDNSLINTEKDYNIKDILQKTLKENVYKIDIKTKEYYSENDFMEIYVYYNDFKNSVISIRKNIRLLEIKNQADMNKADIFLVNNKRTIIKDNALDNFKLEDILFEKDTEKIINFYDKFYYNKIEVIKLLRNIQGEIQKGVSIDWCQQSTLFEALEKFVGKAISDEIKKDLVGNKDLIQSYAETLNPDKNKNNNEINSNSNDTETNISEKNTQNDSQKIKPLEKSQPINDQENNNNIKKMRELEYITKYLQLIVNENNEAAPAQA